VFARCNRPLSPAYGFCGWIIYAQVVIGNGFGAEYLCLLLLGNEFFRFISLLGGDQKLWFLGVEYLGLLYGNQKWFFLDQLFLLWW
jgi:hypothetical protein